MRRNDGWIINSNADCSWISLQLISGGRNCRWCSCWRGNKDCWRIVSILSDAGRFYSYRRCNEEFSEWRGAAVSTNNIIPSLSSSTVPTVSSSSDVSPTPLFCPAEGIWNQTLACNSTRLPTSLRARCLNNQLANGFGKWLWFFAVAILYVLQQFVFVIAMEHGDLNPAKHLLD